MQTLQSRLLAAVVALAGVIGSPMTAMAEDADLSAAPKTPEVFRGAKSFGPYHATDVNVDLRTLPPVPVWQPGDPVKVIPKRYSATPAVKHGPDYKGVGPDALAEMQRAFTLQKGLGDTRALSDPIVNVAGPGFNGVFPPDTTGEVGKNYYVQMINGGGSTVTIINKTDGTLVTPPFSLHNLGTGQCADGLGDPILLYDEVAERWLWSEFSNNGNLMCIYISKTDDPITGGWWAYQLPGVTFPDYPKYGVWPDAYYVGANEDDPTVYALDRNAMLSGGPTSFQRFTVPELPGFGFQVMQPADQDGATEPPAGTPGYFLRHRDDEWHGGSPSNPTTDFMELWEFDVDFVTPANSSVTLTNIGGFADFDSELCDAAIFACFPQPSGPPLDPLREVVMQRVTYRNFGTHESMVGNFVVDIDGLNHGGIRWFELRRPNDTTPWSLYQEGTYTAPLPDIDNRFMGSIAQDQDGNIALAYNVTSSVTFPAMRYTGRLETDPAGMMTQDEKEIIAGSGSNLLNRWGDYAAMSVDPVDGCTFWHTNMYGDLESWGTQIASFRFDECGASPDPDFTLNATNLTQAVCSVGDLDTIAVNVGALAGFSDPVTLAYASMPAGFSGVFSSNPVTPGNSSDADVNVTAAAGDYTFDISGTATGVDVKTVTANISVADAPAGATTLTSPPDAAPAQPASPTLSWTAASQASSYLVEIDDDAGFGSINYSATTAATTHTVAIGLAPTTYYWRVTPSNPCGASAPSATFSFTVSASLCGSGPLVDNGTANIPIAVANPGTITDMNVSLDISHSYIGDLDITLTHVDTGTAVDLILSLQGGFCAESNILTDLDDEATVPVTTQCLPQNPSVNGTFQPEVGSFLSDFDGEILAGTWNLTIIDNAAQDTGQVNEWCLLPEVDAPPPDADGDGIEDSVDNCVFTPNSGQEDGDGDGVGDACDICPTVANPGQDATDDDSDGVPNSCDNCTIDANADQCDTNGDGFGNVCDADLDNNNIVNSFDLSIMRDNFGEMGVNDADMTCDGVVNSFDLTELRNDFGQAPGPSGYAP